MGSEPRRLIGGNGPGVHGSELYGHSKVTSKSQRAFYPIEVFIPWADVEEKALRGRLRDAWQISAARASRSTSGNARQLWWQVSMIASDWVTKRASKTDLKDIADSLVRMFLAANTFERIEGQQS